MNHRLVEKGKPLNSMKLKVKPLSEQRMVLTGATSGIGLVTARLAATKGVKLILNARSEEDLKQLANELGEKGSQVVYVAGDVSKEEDVDQIVSKAIESFGGFDTWVNNASVALYGHAEDIPIEEARRLFDINFWGAVYGMKKAVAHFKDRGEPGVVINIGSVAGNRAFPVQSFYSASKFALHGLTDGMRMELEKSGDPVVISQIHPARVDTPYTNHATSYIDRHPTHRGMVYPPESVAEAILLVAENPKRDFYVGTQS